MRVLHVGWNYWPYRAGGLIFYVDGIMGEQVACGHEVSYFCAGRQVPGLRKARLRRRTRDGVSMYEVLNSAVVVPRGGTGRPDLDLEEPRCQELFETVLRKVQPDVVHVHELLGLPSSVLGIARTHGVAVVMTLHSYATMCPTVRLFDADGSVCQRRQPGEMCTVCCAGAPTDNRHQWWPTASGQFVSLAHRLPDETRQGALAGAKRVVDFVRERHGGRRPLAAPAATSPSDAKVGTPRPAPFASASAPEYDRRRDVNVERLGSVDLLMAPSTGVARFYEELGVTGRNLRVVPITLPHIEKLHARRHRTRVPARLTFATLNGANDKEKGSEVLLDAMRRLDGMGLRGSFDFVLYGSVDSAVEAELVRLGATSGGLYGTADLDDLLEDVDVGIVPSVWEEVLGFVGLEFLAKGVPVIGNARGGIVDYTHDGRTGWLNRSATGRELADIMAGILRRPEQVLRLHHEVLDRRDEVLTTSEQHSSDLEAAYAEAVSRRRFSAGGSSAR